MEHVLLGALLGLVALWAFLSIGKTDHSSFTITRGNYKITVSGYGPEENARIAREFMDKVTR